MISDHYPCFAVFVNILKSRKHKRKLVKVFNHDPVASVPLIMNCRQDYTMSRNPDLCAYPNNN